MIKTPNKPNQRPKIQLLEQGDLFCQSNNALRVFRKSETFSNLVAKAPMKEQGDLFSSCVPVSVELVDKDEDADENVDADQTRMVRPVESEQSMGLFTQREEIDIHFRVQDCHMQLWKKQNISAFKSS